MYFDPADNLFGAPLWIWLAVALIWLGPFAAFYVYGRVLDRRRRKTPRT